MALTNQFRYKITDSKLSHFSFISRFMLNKVEISPTLQSISLFKVEGNNPSLIENLFKYRVTGFSLGSFTVEPAEIPGQFTNIKIQSKITYPTEVTFNIIETSDNDVFKGFKEWLDMIFEVDYNSSGLSGAKYYVPNIYKANFTIHVYKLRKDPGNVTNTTWVPSTTGDDKDVLFEITFYGLFPKSISNPSYDISTYDLVTRDIQCQFDYVKVVK